MKLFYHQNTLRVEVLQRTIIQRSHINKKVKVKTKGNLDEGRAISMEYGALVELMYLKKGELLIFQGSSNIHKGDFFSSSFFLLASNNLIVTKLL